MAKNILISNILVLCFLVFSQNGLAQNRSSEGLASKKSYAPYGAWSKSMVTAFKMISNNPTLAAADSLLKASDDMPKKNWENFLLCATLYAPNGKTEKAFMAIDKAVASGFRDVDLFENLPQLESLRKSTQWTKYLELVKAANDQYKQQIKEPKLLEELKDMWDKDQSALRIYNERIQSLGGNVDSKTNDSLFKPILKIWDSNRMKLDSIIAIHGWPGNTLIGEDGAKLAWAIPQHHPDVFFKLRCLDLIEQAMKRDDVAPNHYAELHDRIARDTWQKQKYGAAMDANGPIPIKDPKKVNQRRWDLGLPDPVEVYAAYHGHVYKTETEEAIRKSHQKAQKDYQAFELHLADKAIDSTNHYIRKAIRSYGNISNEQLFTAAVKLAKTDNTKSKKLSYRILKVLIWRDWESKEKIRTTESLSYFLDEEEWIELLRMLGE